MPKTSTPARTFTIGQRVYVKSYSGFSPAIVIDPDAVERSSGGWGNRPRDVHYVTVHYVKAGGEVQTDRQWNILRSRTKLFTEEEYAAEMHSKDIGRMRSDLQDAIDIVKRRNRFYEHAIEFARLAGADADPTEAIAERRQAIAARLETFFDFRRRYSNNGGEPEEDMHARERDEGDRKIAKGHLARTALLALSLDAAVPEIPASWEIVGYEDDHDVVDFAHSGCQHCGIIDGHLPDCEARA